MSAQEVSTFDPPLLLLRSSFNLKSLNAADSSVLLLLYVAPPKHLLKIKSFPTGATLVDLFQGLVKLPVLFNSHICEFVRS